MTHYSEVAREIQKDFDRRRSLICDHCERQYDDDMCDKCFSKRLYGKALQALTQAHEAGRREGVEASTQEVSKTIVAGFGRMPEEPDHAYLKGIEDAKISIECNIRQLLKEKES